MKLFGYQITPVWAENIPPQRGKTSRPSAALVKTPIDRVVMQMNTLKNAVDSAIDIYNPDRRDLIGIYENVAKDAHVISQLEIAFNKVISQPFVLSKNGTDDEEATKLLKKEWFEDFQRFCIEPEFWGYTLIEFGLIDDKGEFTECDVFARRNVLPFSYAVCFDANSPNGAGIAYEIPDDKGNSKDLKQQLFLIEMGKADKLGKFETIAREVIWKNFANTDWSQGSEKFGMPFIDIATDSDDPNELNRIENMARNFAANGYVIRGMNDEVKIVQAIGRDFYKIYLEKVKMCDEQISKCINGATGASDQQAYVGAAQVHERTTDEFHHSRMRRITNVVNAKLIPFLVFHGYPVDGCEFRYTAFDDKPEAITGGDANPKVDPNADPNADPVTHTPGGTVPPKTPASPKKEKPATPKKAQAASRPW